jgi:hypothetical protein
MLNTVLAVLATALWVGAYGWYFSGDLYRWWHRRRVRRAYAAQRRAQDAASYAHWVQNIPPPPSRVRLPPPRRAAPPTPAREGVVVPFPRRHATRR